MKPFYHRIGRKSSPLSPSYSQESSVFLFLRWSWPKLVESERWLQQREGGDHFEETSWKGGGRIMWWRCFDIHFCTKKWLFISNNRTNVIYSVVCGYCQITQFGDKRQQYDKYQEGKRSMSAFKTSSTTAPIISNLLIWRKDIRTNSRSWCTESHEQTPEENIAKGTTDPGVDRFDQ